MGLASNISKLAIKYNKIRTYEWKQRYKLIKQRRFDNRIDSSSHLINDNLFLKATWKRGENEIRFNKHCSNYIKSELFLLSTKECDIIFKLRFECINLNKYNHESFSEGKPTNNIFTNIAKAATFGIVATIFATAFGAPS